MGTSYVILDDGKGNLIEAHEMSCKFSLETGQVDVEGYMRTNTISDLTVEQLVQAGVELLKVASYFLDAQEMQVEVNRYLGNGYRPGVVL